MKFLNTRDAYRWNTAIRGLLESNYPKKALLGYSHIRKRGLTIDSHTLVVVFKACTLISQGFLIGQQIHAQISKLGFQSNTIMQTSLLRLYCLFGSLPSAQKVFDETPDRDAALWNALIAAYSQGDHPQRAFLAAQTMILESVRPNESTVVSILSACSKMRALAQGKLVHGYAIRNLINFDTFVYNGLISMYSKCHCLSTARRLFDMLPSKNVVSWTVMISGYTDNNCPNEALDLFKQMESAKVRPDEVTVLGVVSMCAGLGSAELGEWIDDYVERNGFRKCTYIENALIDMHCKCGNLERSCQIFERMEERTLISWSVMIQGLAMHGQGMAALVRFAQMQREGFRPDEIIFISAINACSHAGLVKEGKECFKSMVEDYGLVPWMEHYGVMVDLFCKAGLVQAAVQFVAMMPMKPDAAIWRVLVGACRDHGDIDTARWVIDRLIEMEPKHSGNYVLKSNLEAMMAEWDAVKEVRKEMGERGLSKKDPARSVIEVN